MADGTRTLRCVLLAVCFVAFAAAPAAAASSDAAVAKIRAAFLSNFLKFIEWPDGSFASAEAPIVIGILGDDDFSKVVAGTVENQRLAGRGVVVAAFDFPPVEQMDERRRGEAMRRFREHFARCHMVYLAPNHHDRLAQMRAEASARRIVFVGEGKRFAAGGGMLALERDDDRIVLFANLDAIEASDVSVSSKLLRLAKPIGSEK